MPEKNRKGQFFIISAVVVLLVIFTIFSDLDTDWRSDVSDVQANDAKIILRNIENEISATVLAYGSSTAELREKLENLAIAEKNNQKERYSMNIFYSITDLDVRANVTLKSTELYVEKMIVVSR